MLIWTEGNHSVFDGDGAKVGGGDLMAEGMEHWRTLGKFASFRILILPVVGEESICWVEIREETFDVEVGGLEDSEEV